MVDIKLLARLRVDGAVSEEDFDLARGGGDFELADDSFEEDLFQENAVAPDWADHVSQEAIAFIIEKEVSSKAYYVKKLKSPVWPGGRSGVTIGVGFDLGYVSGTLLKQILAPRLPEAHVSDLLKVVGLKGDAAKARIAELAHIEVPWSDAVEIFNEHKLPRFAALTARTFGETQCRELHPHSFGALVSLVFNRGSNLKGDRRRHMAEIKSLLEKSEIAHIPQQFREMTVLWENKGLSGLIARRREEAALFEAGVAAREAEIARLKDLLGPASPYADPNAALAAGVLGAADRVGSYGPLSVDIDQLTRQRDGDAAGYLDAEAPDYEEEAFQESAPAWDGVSWAEDAESPDYAHLPPYAYAGQTEDLRGKSFEFSLDTLKLLLRANAFAPQTPNARIPFALRGAILISDHQSAEAMEAQEGRGALLLREIRPDHRRFRCVIGVINLETGEISGYKASTVPARGAVLRQQSKAPGAGDVANMMVTGLYPFTVGWHLASKQKSRVPGCLTENGHQKAVLRSQNNLRYELTDALDSVDPMGDNLHPSFSDRSADFSSYGCLVVSGGFRGRGRATGTHTGAWARFRNALGLQTTGTADHGKVFDLALLTGLDAIAAARLIAQRRTDERAAIRPHLLRLRQGSKSDHVRRLQEKLGATVDGHFGAKTAQALYDHQAKAGHAQRHVTFSPALDDKLGFDVFARPPAPEPDPALPDLLLKPREESALLEAVERDAERNARWRDERYYELGLRTNLAAAQPEAIIDGQIDYDPTIYHEIALVDFIEAGKRALLRIERNLMMFMCGDDERDHADRARVRKMITDAADMGVAALRAAVEKALAWIYVPPVIASTAAELIVERILVERVARPVVDELGATLTVEVNRVCSFWMRRLDA